MDRWAKAEGGRGNGGGYGSGAEAMGGNLQCFPVGFIKIISLASARVLLVLELVSKGCPAAGRCCGAIFPWDEAVSVKMPLPTTK